MEAHLRSLGWNEVEVINEDLGRSAGGGVIRTGFDSSSTPGFRKLSIFRGLQF
jgi:hypothetical protein